MKVRDALVMFESGWRRCVAVNGDRLKALVADMISNLQELLQADRGVNLDAIEGYLESN